MNTLSGLAPPVAASSSLAPSPNPDATQDLSPSPSDDDMLQGEARATLWTSWSGCGALALDNMRLRSARTRLTKRSCRIWAEDLKDLGVGIVGHRRKILDAIAALRAEESTKMPSATVAHKTETTPEDRAERRQVTVMFSDLVGSTALSGRMDPEDLREVISSYQKCVAETVGRFGGFVAKYMGDGVLVYFGYPQAHEYDAERAVRAGLEVVAAISGLKTHAALQTRVGIATGLVVVGDLIGSGASQEQAIVGETPNLAARLQGLAEPNSVVIADNTRKLVGNLFELEDLGAQELKGIAGAVKAWTALRPASSRVVDAARGRRN